MGDTKMTTVIQLMLVTLFCIVSNHATASDYMNEQEEVPEIVIAFGAANIFDSSRYAGVGLEYRFVPVWRKLRPIVGYAATREQDQYVYIGVRYFFKLNDVWLFNPTFAVGLFDSDDGINLGGNVQFRSGFEFSREINDRVRFGFGFSHLSNSRIYRSNPGTETVELTLAITL
jgi:hypothetical protein